MSPYKDKEKQKEYWKDKKRQQRLSTPTENVHPIVHPKTMPSGGRVTPALLNALTDKVKRQELGAICQALSRRDLGGEVRFGVGGVTFKDIEELLLTTA